MDCGKQLNRHFRRKICLQVRDLRAEISYDVKFINEV